MEQLSKDNGVDLGTGYPHDPLSLKFIRDYIREHECAPIIARSSWITTQRLMEELLG